MPAQGRFPALIRLLRLMAALSLIVAVTAVATILTGSSAAKSQALVAAAIIFGLVALLGMALVALPYANPKKDQNDPRP